MILIVFASNFLANSSTFLICTLLSAVPKSVVAFAWLFEFTAELTSPEHMLLTVVLPLCLLMVELLTTLARARAKARAGARTDLAEVKAVARAMARAKVVLAKDFHRVRLLAEVKELTAVVMAPMEVVVTVRLVMVGP
jgi:hypothetical protein